MLFVSLSLPPIVIAIALDRLRGLSSRSAPDSWVGVGLLGPAHDRRTTTQPPVR
jgi:hypothetical protein